MCLKGAEKLDGCFQSTGKSRYWRLEKWLSDNCWLQNVGSAVGAVGTELTGTLKGVWGVPPPPPPEARPWRMP